MVVWAAVPEQSALVYSSTVTFGMPVSPVSWTPSASVSFQTKSPREAVWYMPASQVVSFSPALRSIWPVQPVAGSGSLSVVSSPWLAGLRA